MKRRGTTTNPVRGARRRGDGHLATAPIAAAGKSSAREALEASNREEIASHRRRLAAALGAELPAASPTGIERALARAAESPDPAATLAESTGRSEEEIDEVFEAMARHAREAVLRD